MSELRPPDMLQRILNSRVRDILPTATPLSPAPLLAEALGGREVLIKREDLTPVFSFKIRGAYNRIAQLGPEEVSRGIIAASAGNHAQGVAYSAKRRNLACTIVMPRTTPPIKVEAVRRLGAQLRLHGDNYSEAAEHCRQLVQDTGAYFVHPFDDLEVIAGQGTIGMELLGQCSHGLQAVFVPIGGGGLAAGVGAYIKAVRPGVKVIGVEPDDSDAMSQSLAAGRRVKLDHVGIFADGVAVKEVGAHTFDLCQRYVDEVVCVSSDEICAAIKDGFTATRTILEGAGAVALAGLKRYLRSHSLPPGPVVAVASGANISFNRLRYITERTEVGERKEGLFAVKIPEQAGSFRRFYRSLGDRSVTEFSYRLGRRNSQAHVFLGVELRAADEARAIVQSLGDAGFEGIDLTDDELAKSHIRYLVGGRASEVSDERMYELEFPERAGALDDFLDRLADRWNISLFHYRNHGTIIGRVLCGFEVPDAELAEFTAALEAIGYRFRAAGPSRAIESFLS